MAAGGLMEHRWMKGVVVLFWMATMTWLVVEKVLPPLERGDPPTFHSAYGDLDPQCARHRLDRRLERSAHRLGGEPGAASELGLVRSP